MKSVNDFTWSTLYQLHRLCYSLQKVANSYLWLLKSQYPWIWNEVMVPSHSPHQLPVIDRTDCSLKLTVLNCVQFSQDTHIWLQGSGAKMFFWENPQTTLWVQFYFRYHEPWLCDCDLCLCSYTKFCLLGLTSILLCLSYTPGGQKPWFPFSS